MVLALGVQEESAGEAEEIEALELMHPLIRELVACGPIVTDGAWGTELQARGLAMGEFSDVWNLTHPEAVAEVAKAYVEAGSQIILTNTFGANRLRLAEVGQVNRAGVMISRKAAGAGVRVFGSMGPSGGKVIGEELKSIYAEQAAALAAAGAEGIVVETMIDLEDARVAVSAARLTGLPVVACMVFDSHCRTLRGVCPKAVAQALEAAGADVIGANCGQGTVGLAALCRELRAATRLPIWMKPNAGLPEVIDGRARYRVGPEEFAACMVEVVEAGARFVGGCCGTGPEHIRALRRTLL